LASNQDIHGVDLDDSHVVKGSPQVTSIDPTWGPLTLKTLGSKRSPACLRDG
jgi:hypothetical protein